MEDIVMAQEKSVGRPDMGNIDAILVLDGKVEQGSHRPAIPGACPVAFQQVGVERFHRQANTGGDRFAGGKVGFHQLLDQSFLPG